MILHKTSLEGVLRLDLDVHRDARGSFAEAWNSRDSSFHIHQVNFSMSAIKGTFRGLHYQDPNPQIKIVFAVRGSALDVVVDVRRDSPTWLKYGLFELTPDNGTGVYVPPGFAHGWLALEDRSQICYLVDGHWSKGDERGLRYDDPAITLQLPAPVRVVAPRDAQWPLINSSRES
jgi:dTDP-4-dehydrorhamnose 3,5-epimerase